MKPWIWIMLLILLTGVVAGTIFMSPFRYLMFPPDDLYKPLAIDFIDIDQAGSEYAGKFKNKYSGTHMVALVVGNPPPIGEAFEIGQLGLSLAMRQNGNIILEETINKYLYPFWGHDERYSGVALMNYEVPDDLPKDEILEYQIKVVERSDEWAKKYENIRFLIAKISDK